MYFMRRVVFLVMVFIAVLMISSVSKDVYGMVENPHLHETRYCGEPARDHWGKIRRNSYVVKVFKRLYPLPADYISSEWSVDHVIPLAVGGCDAISNLQWLPNSIKNTSDQDNKDRWERRLYPKQYEVPQ